MGFSVLLSKDSVPLPQKIRNTPARIFHVLSCSCPLNPAGGCLHGMDVSVQLSTPVKMCHVQNLTNLAPVCVKHGLFLLLISFAHIFLFGRSPVSHLFSPAPAHAPVSACLPFCLNTQNEFRAESAGLYCVLLIICATPSGFKCSQSSGLDIQSRCIWIWK